MNFLLIFRFFKLFMDLLESCEHFKPCLESLFQGKLNSVVECKNCHTKSIRGHTFTELELPVQGNHHVEECIENYRKEEILDGNNQYHCEICNGLQDATKKIELAQLPKILNLHLMRFVFDPKTLKKKKLQSKINFPHVLDIKGFDQKYQLSAVLVHKGQAANGGHYVAHARDEINNTWWTFDDHKVTPIKELSAETLEEEKDNGGNKKQKTDTGVVG
jgi:ubiquitin carboxyl-terminal hydrolase 48